MNTHYKQTFKSKTKIPTMILVNSITVRNNFTMLTYPFVPTVRTYCSVDADEYSSLKDLAKVISYTYQKLPDMFNFLTEKDVEKIITLILNDKFTLDPLLINKRKIDKKDKKSITYNPFYSIIIFDGSSSFYYLFITCTAKDSLVLEALGNMLQCHFLKNEIFSENIFSDKMGVSEFCGFLYSLGPVKRLYKIDLRNSVSNLNRDSLMLKLSHIVKDVAILKLVKSFLFSPYMDENGKVTSNRIELNNTFLEINGIPSYGYLSVVLYNFFLTELDNKFPLAFPGVDYKRYTDSLFISCFDEDSLLDEQEVLSFLESLNLIGNLSSIGPGDGNTLLYSGRIIKVNKQGYIHSTKNEDLIEEDDDE